MVIFTMAKFFVRLENDKMEETKKVESMYEAKANKSGYKRAKRKTWIIFAVFAAIFIGIGVVGSIFLGIGAGICAGAFYAIVALIYFPGEFKRVKNNFCQECGARFDYKTCVDWEVGEIEIKEKRANPNSDKKQIIGVRIEHVNITCTCAKCGNEISFTRKFQTGVEYDNNTAKIKNVEPMIKRYFKL